MGSKGAEESSEGKSAGYTSGSPELDALNILEGAENCSNLC